MIFLRVIFLLLGLLTAASPCFADSYSPVTSTGVSAGTTATTVGGVPGSCLAYTPTGPSVSVIFTMSCAGDVGIHSLSCSASPCGSGGGSSPMVRVENPSSYFAAFSNGDETTYSGVGILPVGMVIGHVNITGIPYNTTDATAGNLPYSTLDANGLGGGTVTIGVINSTHTFASPLVLATVVMPTSPQNGPWVTSVTAAVGSPYTVQAGDGLVTLTNAVDAVAAQWVAQVAVYVGQ